MTGEQSFLQSDLFTDMVLKNVDIALLPLLYYTVQTFCKLIFSKSCCYKKCPSLLKKVTKKFYCMFIPHLDINCFITSKFICIVPNKHRK